MKRKLTPVSCLLPLDLTVFASTDMYRGAVACFQIMDIVSFSGYLMTLYRLLRHSCNVCDGQNSLLMATALFLQARPMLVPGDVIVRGLFTSRPSC
jgi:hypothetical protein